MLRIDLASRTPVYEQIVSGLRSILVSGRLSVGDQLPTVRQLAMDLGTHHNTVAQAYRILAEEGWLRLKRGRGAVVVQRRTPSPKPEAHAQFVRQIKEIVAKAIAEGVPASSVSKEMLSLSSKLPGRRKSE